MMKLFFTLVSCAPSPNKLSFHVAPMQCYTNAPLRNLFHLLSPSSIKWTEMEKVDDLFPKNESSDYLFDQLEKRLGSPQDYDEASHLVLQLGSNDPTRLQTCVQHTLQNYNFKEINLNCGCPSIESGGSATYGASLMKDASLTARLVGSVRNGIDTSVGAHTDNESSVPAISVKCRIGIFEHADDMRPLDDQHYVYLQDYISRIYDAGANHVILHARPAILSGLSPVKNRILPKLDYQFVERIANDFSGKMDVTLNGGIGGLTQLESMQEVDSRVNNYMAGRWCLRRPLDLVGVEAMLKREELDLTSIRDSIECYIDYAKHMASLPSHRQRFTMVDLCLPLFLVVEQLKDDYDLDHEEMEGQQRPLLNYDEIESLYSIVRDGVVEMEEFSKSGKKKKKKMRSDDINFKRLSSSFKSLVGTKVANKWKRNRAEL